MFAFASLAAALAVAAGVLPPLVPVPNPSNGFPAVGSALFSDDGSVGDTRAVWGKIDCQRGSRVRVVGGHRTIRVLDGDDAVGERCEIGRNNWPASPVALYRSGERLITVVSLKLSKRFPLERGTWQSVMQMKQSQPSNNGGGTPVLSLHAFDGRWRLRRGGVSEHVSQVWSTQATRGHWTRFAFDVTYSTDPSVGSVRVAADQNGDGDALDRGERSPQLHLATLVPEGPGDDSDGLADGDPIPSHLRLGVYHDPSYRCHGYRCSIGVDNVGIYLAE